LVKKTLCAILFIVGLALVTFSARAIWSGRLYDAAARTEYALLREIMSEIVTATPLPAYMEEYAGNSVDPTETQTNIPPLVYVNPLAESMRAFTDINPDFVGWMEITDVGISYPIVRGSDNVLYLDTTFGGDHHLAGSIFMDYRCLDGFHTPVSVLYGHNMRDGSMFSMLTSYLQPVFMDEHDEIVVTTVDGDELVYRIFEARRADAWDDVYALDFNDAQAAEAFFGKPKGSRFLVLSTCIIGGDRNARVLVIAVSYP